MRERLNALLAESDSSSNLAVRWDGSIESLEANIFDAIEAELQPDGAIAEDMATALRSSLGADDRRVVSDEQTGGPSVPRKQPEPDDSAFVDAVAASLEVDRDSNRDDTAAVNRRTRESLIPRDVAERIARALRSAA